MKRKLLPLILCEHEPEHENYDPSLLRRCNGSVGNLVECVKCYTLLDERNL